MSGVGRVSCVTPSWGRLAQRALQSSDAPADRCDLCGESLATEHRHLLEVASRQLVCACYACTVLFDRDGASAGRYRLVPNRRVHLRGAWLSDEEWTGLQIPVGIAFLYMSTPAGQIAATYPSPLGPTDSVPNPDLWSDLVRRMPVLGALEPDVECLLVNRARGASDHFVAPVDDCYRLVGLVRRHWRGLTGGQDVWPRIEEFFADLKRRCSTHDTERGEHGGDDSKHQDR